MTIFRPLVTPLALALRRLRRRPVQTALLTLALALAAGLVGASNIVGALAHEDSVRLRLSELAPGDRALRIAYRLGPDERKPELASATQGAFQTFRQLTSPVQEIRVWDPIAPPDQRGARLVTAEDGEVVRLELGRLPSGCDGNTCEALALGGGSGLGRVVRLGGEPRSPVSARIVGRGTLSSAVLPSPELLGDQALLVDGVTETPLAAVEAGSSVTLISSAPLVPSAVHASGLPSLADRLRAATVRLERTDASVRASAPDDVLTELDRRGRVAKERLLLIAGQGAALVLAFAAFAAAARREDDALAQEQLATIGGSRAQLVLARIGEALVPSLLGAVIALIGLVGALFLLVRTRDLPNAFVGEALPLSTIGSVFVLATIGAALLVVSVAPRPPRRFGVGTLEVAAVTALGLIVWQASSTSALDPGEIAEGAGGAPILLFIPALAVFAAAVLLLRLLPLGFRIAERLTRRGPLGLGLALVSAARNPAQAAAATTFLAVALGSALFSLNYRSTLEEQSADAASFQVGAEWRITENTSPPGVTSAPLTRLSEVASEPPAPALRLNGTIAEGGGQTSVEVLALPASRLADMAGWRDNFSSLPREEIGRRIRPRAVALHGIGLDPDATRIRVWARGETDSARSVILHLLRDGRFEEINLGEIGSSWRLLSAELPASFGGSQLVGIEFTPLAETAASAFVAPGGVIGNVTTEESFVQFGGLEQGTSGRWSVLPGLDEWVAAEAPDFEGIALPQEFAANAPVAEGIQFDLGGTSRPLVRPPLDLPLARSQGAAGPYIIPALAGVTPAASAVDGMLTLDLLGRELRIRVAARAELFPTVTEEPSSFLVLDYDTLFAALNVDTPGTASPSEAWFFESQSPRFAAALGQPAFVDFEVLSRERTAEKLREDPLAAGTMRLLTWSGFTSAALALLGLALATRSALAAERPLLAEYEALGISPRTLARSIQIRLLALSFVGLIGALVGAALAVQLVSALVAVTGTGGRPLPPIETEIAWQLGGALVVGVAFAAVLIAALFAAGALRETTARRMRA